MLPEGNHAIGHAIGPGLDGNVIGAYLEGVPQGDLRCNLGGDPDGFRIQAAAGQHRGRGNMPGTQPGMGIEAILPEAAGFLAGIGIVIGAGLQIPHRDGDGGRHIAKGSGLDFHHRVVPHGLGGLPHLQAHGPVNVHAVGGLGAVGGDVVIQALLLGHQGILDHLDGIAEVGGQLLQGGGDLGKSGGGQAQQEGRQQKGQISFHGITFLSGGQESAAHIGGGRGRPP